jgi:riboflavin synthase
MFTGLIEEIGIVDNVVNGQKSAQITVRAKKIMNDLNIGDSIATNGVCLTVVKFNPTNFTVDVMPETMAKSNLNQLRSGSVVNLERALRVGDRLGGHMVSGHVDGKGTIVELVDEDNATWISVKATPDILKYVISKGSIAIDGISLTVAYVDYEMFKVSLIPLTMKDTTLRSKRIGEAVNLECDMVGKYIERLSLFKSDEGETKPVKRSIDMEFLKNNGFA